jgi:hypothetical protein
MLFERPACGVGDDVVVGQAVLGIFLVAGQIEFAQAGRGRDVDLDEDRELGRVVRLAFMLSAMSLRMPCMGRTVASAGATPCAAGGAGLALAGAGCMARRMSTLVILPPGPVPWTSLRSMPWALAKSMAWGLALTLGPES